MQIKLRYLPILLASTMSVSGTATAQELTADGFVKGVVRVKLQPEVASRLSNAVLPASKAGVLTTGIRPLDRAAKQVKAVSMRRMIPYSPKFEARHKAAGLDLWYVIEYDASIQPAEVRNIYKSVAGVQLVENVKPMKLIGGEKFRRITVSDLNTNATTAMPFDDPMLPSQWHYNNDGSIPGTVVGADANVFKGWEIETGKKDVLVAIVDGGFQVDHPDLAQNVYVNEAEKNGKPGVDDDGNGYTDDVYGYNFVINSADVNAHSHGTHVAGTVGAVNGNGLGVAGVAGGSGEGGVKMLVCQIFDERASASMGGDQAAALVYAADMGASIAQCSWGWAEDGYYEQAVLDAVKYFTKNGGGKKMRGGLCIFANGNTSSEGTFYPAAMDEVVAVASMTADKKGAYYSSRGPWCDVAAPGGLLDKDKKHGVLSTLPNGEYGYNEGTSMACPHVSGIAALVLSKYGNPNFSNETLRTQLVSSVNDLYASDPSIKGLFGSGYIDAYKALQISQGEAPAAVSTFKITPSQDNVLMEWNVPDSKDKMVDHHVVYYSTKPFTAETLNEADKVNVDTKYLNSGDAVTYELQGLTPLTTYYIAIQAFSRWGDGSALSEVKKATTNAGPKVQLDKTSLELAVDATKGKVAQGDFTIANNGEGLLKYSLAAATVKVSASAYALSAPKPGLVVPYNGRMGVEKAVNHRLVAADFQADAWPQEMRWTNDIYAYLGDTDPKKSNALAQYFYVAKDSFPEGFNLTALRFGGFNGQNPVIEIYDGSVAISKASLLKTVTYDHFAYGTDLNLDEQLHFAPGSSFWVVAKFPAGQKNPLGSGVSTKENSKQYTFFSNDNGVTWMQLSEALKGGGYENMAEQLVWDVAAISKNPDWSVVMQPTPAEGTVRPGESQKVTVKNDGQTLVNGTYTFNLKVKSNETPNPNHKVQVSLKVTGNKPALKSAQLVDFGSLIVGQEKTLTVQLVNNGFGPFAGAYGDLYSDNLHCTSDQFELPDVVNPIAARSKSTIDVTYRPTKAGDVTANVTLTDKNGIKHSFVVRGVASEPAKFATETPEVDFGNLDVTGDDITKQLVIKNEGKYPLEFAFPKYSDKQIAGAESSHKFGYTYVSNMGDSQDASYDGNPELKGEVDITKQFSDQAWQSEPVKIGFKFPFYGTEYEQIYVSSHGGLTFKKADGNISCMIPTADCVEGLGYISAYANSGKLSITANSKVTYGQQDGKFVVKFKDVATPGTNGGGDITPISFHISLSPDGTIELFYDDYNPAMVWGNGSYIYAGISDTECLDVFRITDYDLTIEDRSNSLYQQIVTGTAIKILAPAKSMIKKISEVDGVVGIGESKSIDVTVSGKENNLYAGELENLLTVVTNDPKNSSFNFVLKANVTGDLHAEAKTDSSEIRFGKVFRTSDSKRSVLLSNEGRNALNVTAVTMKNGKFALTEDVKKPFTVSAGQSRDIVVMLPTETEGAVSDEMVIAYADGKQTVIPVSGTVIGTPTWTLTPERLDITTPYGKNVDKQFTVENKGNEPLEFNIQPEFWFNIKDLTADKDSRVDYVFEALSDGMDVPYAWEDITKDYDSHQPLAYYNNLRDTVGVDLPFEFPFYGKKYNRMYVYNTGFVQFTKPDTDYKQFPEPPTALPTTETFYHNIIAPFWGNHSMGSAWADGTYVKTYEDRVVVSFMNYGNSAMAGMNFQVILFKDGTFKFQYDMSPEGIMMGVYGLCGIQDETGTRGLNPADSYINPGNAMLFRPVKSYTVAPNTKKNVDVEFMATEMAALYERNIQMTTNVPGKENVKLPVALNITGEAKPEFPKELTINAPADLNYIPQPYEFTISNKGDKAFTITGIQSNLMEMDMETYMTEGALMVYAKSQNGGGEVGPGPVAVSDENMQWIQYTDALPITVGREPVKFQFYHMNVATPHDLKEKITFTTEGLATATTELPVHITVTEAPALSFSKDEIVINNAKPGYVGEESMWIKNKEGKYKLTYSLHLDSSGRDAETEQGGGGGIAPTQFNVMAQIDSAAALFSRYNIVQPFALDKQPKADDYMWDVPQDGNYTNLIYYPVAIPLTHPVIMGTGSDLTSNFRAATRFVAPAEGFNLSQIYFAGTIGNLENVDIEAYVIAGSDVTSEKIITKGKIRVEKEEPAETGQYSGDARTITFEKPVYFNPTDTFYVVVKYPAGYGHSAVLAGRKGEMEMNRSMAYVESMGGWFDIEEALDANYGYGAMGYFMTAVETEKGQPWIKLLDSATEGTIEVGDSAQVKFHIEAARAYSDQSRATLVVKSNDPMQRVVNYHITLNKNQAPAAQFEAGTPTVAEGDSIEVNVIVADPEGDAFSVNVVDENGIATISKAVLSDKTEVTPVEGKVEVPAKKSLTLTMQLAPDYGTAGLRHFIVNTTDALGNTAVNKAYFNVEFTNRAPEYIGEAEFEMQANTTSPSFSYESLFKDPEGDEMTFSVKALNSALLRLYTDPTGFVIQAMRQGSTTLTITATDSVGNTTEAKMKVRAVKPSGIAGVTTDANFDLKVDGNELRVTIGRDATNAVFRIFDAAGRVAQTLNASQVSAGDVRTFNLTNLPTGVYSFSATFDGQEITRKFTK